MRWKAHGTYRGALPGGAPQAAGREATFTGTDALRIAGGKLAEYWETPTACCSCSNSASARCPPGDHPKGGT